MDAAALGTLQDENPGAMRRRGKRVDSDVVMMMKRENGGRAVGTPVMVAPSVMFATEDHVTTCKRVALNNSGSLRPPQKPVNTA